MSCRIADLGVDYLTITAPVGGTAIKLLELADTVASVEYSSGQGKEKDHAVQGYRGVQVGRIFYGTRDDGAMVRCSSGVADYFAGGLGDWARRCNVPRVDLQVTGQLDWDNQWYAQSAAQKARAASHREKGGRPFHVQLIDGGARGSTCSIGSRHSARYLRLYDKSREKVGDVDPNLWRWEIEYKPPLAPKVLASIIENNDARAYIAAQVYAEYSAKGVVPPWESLTEVAPVNVGRPETDLERTLRWLREQVAPTLRRLDAGGHTGAYMSALGLLDGNSGDRL